MEEWKVRHRWSSLECVKQDVLYPMYVLSPDSRNTSDWHTEKQHSHLNFHHPTSHPTDIPQIFLEYLCFHIIHPSLSPPPPPLGRPKQGDLGSVGDFAAGSEMAFCTLLQRSYAVLGARMHYGHPDLMNKQHLGRVRAGGSGTVQWRIWMDFFLRLVLTGTMEFGLTFHILGIIIIPTDELIFLRGVETTNQLWVISYNLFITRVVIRWDDTS